MNEKKAAHILIAFVLGYIPLIVRLHVFSPHLESFDWFYSEPIQSADFFLYHKSVLIAASGVIMLVWLIVRTVFLKDRDLLKEKLLIPVMVYAAFVLISGIASPYRSFAFSGVCEDFETVIVVLSYVVIFIFSYCFIKDESDLSRVLKVSFPGVAIMHLLALSQLAGADFFQSGAGKYLLLPAGYLQNADKLSFPFKEHVIYASLYNSNYVPQYFCFFFFTALMYAFASKGGKRIAFFVMSCISFICMSGSRSKSGMVAFFIAGLFLLCAKLSERYGKKKAAVIAIAGMIAAVGTVSVYETMRSDTDNEEHALTAIETDDDELVFFKGDDELHIRFAISDTGIDYNITDKEGEKPDVYVSESRTMVNEGVFEDTVFDYAGEYDGKRFVNIRIEDHDFRFENDTDGTYRYLNSAGNTVKMRDVDAVRLFSDSFFSGRGNIWNHALPIIRSCLFKGLGAGTFGLVYPQDDYISKEFNNISSVYDFHAHSLYLQNILGNGLPALAAFLFLPVYCFLRFLREGKGNALILAGILAYLIIGLTADSNVCTAPVYWIFLAICINIDKNNISTSK
ncbi:MAG: O-antigen ligase family protein [Lachnospiraceae bacterium]|nr:O-antigen ligase family protein [Lachnospiraceae bacterium]